MTWRFHFPLRNYDFKLDISLYIPHVHDMAFSLSTTQLRL